MDNRGWWIILRGGESRCTDLRKSIPMFMIADSVSGGQSRLECIAVMTRSIGCRLEIAKSALKNSGYFSICCEWLKFEKFPNWWENLDGTAPGDSIHISIARP